MKRTIATVAFLLGFALIAKFTYDKMHLPPAEPATEIATETPPKPTQPQETPQPIPLPFGNQYDTIAEGRADGQLTQPNAVTHEPNSIEESTLESLKEEEFEENSGVPQFTESFPENLETGGIIASPEESNKEAANAHDQHDDIEKSFDMGMIQNDSQDADKTPGHVEEL